MRQHYREETPDQLAAVGTTTSTNSIGKSAARPTQIDTGSTNAHNRDGSRREAVRSSKESDTGLRKGSDNYGGEAATLETAGATDDSITPSSSTQSESCLQIDSGATKSTTVDHLGIGLHIGWRDDDHDAKRVSASTGTTLPPAVRTNTAEEAEALGTETDIEDDEANLLALTKTDL